MYALLIFLTNTSIWEMIKIEQVINKQGSIEQCHYDGATPNQYLSCRSVLTLCNVQYNIY